MLRAIGEEEVRAVVAIQIAGGDATDGVAVGEEAFERVGGIEGVGERKPGAGGWDCGEERGGGAWSCRWFLRRGNG